MYTVYCAGQPVSGKKKGKKEAQRIETDIIMGLERSSVMADAKFKKETNKIIEIITVDRTNKQEHLHQECPLMGKFHGN